MKYLLLCTLPLCTVVMTGCSNPSPISAAPTVSVQPAPPPVTEEGADRISFYAAFKKGRSEGKTGKDGLMEFFQKFLWDDGPRHRICDAVQKGGWPEAHKLLADQPGAFEEFAANLASVGYKEPVFPSEKDALFDIGYYWYHHKPQPPRH